MHGLPRPAPILRPCARAGLRYGGKRMKRLLALAVPILLATGLVGPAPVYGVEPPDDIPACDAGDPDFGTNCEDAGAEDGDLRDGYLDARQIPGDTITPGDIDLANQQAA